MTDLPRLTTPHNDAAIDSYIFRIPKHCREGLLNYLRHGIPPGGFLRAVLEDSLCQAWIHGDYNNRPALAEYASFLYHCAPADAWGSSKNVRDWIAKGVAARLAANVGQL